MALRLLRPATHSAPATSLPSRALRQCRRPASTLVSSAPAVRSHARLRSPIPPHSTAWSLGGPSRGARTFFIQNETTPNPDALKFLPGHRVLPEGFPATFVEYLNPRSTISPPYPSPLAAQLLAIDGVKAIFYGADFITVTKDADAQWAHIRPEVLALITEAVTAGHTIVSVVDRSGAAGEAEAEAEKDSLAYDENDDEVVGMIKELLETRIRPAIQEDGGDIEFRGFVDGYVQLKLRGACRTCDSSTVTLKNGIEGMLMHYVSLVTFMVHEHPLTLCARSKKSRAFIRSSTRRRRSRQRSLPSLRKSSRPGKRRHRARLRDCRRGFLYAIDRLYQLDSPAG
jgi:Fe-S cluster biogenesis protein NfuA